MFLARISLCLIAGVVLESAAQSPPQRPITGIYTDMASSDGEHIGGTEVFVLQGGGDLPRRSSFWQR